METLEPILAEHPFFKGMSPELLKLLVGCASNVKFEAGDFVSREGQETSEFFIIRQGKVALELFSPTHGAITVETLGDGDVMGWSWLLPPYRSHFDARAVELTRAIRFDGKCLRGKLEEDHHLGYDMLKRFVKIIAERLSATRLQLLDIYGTRV
jgi:CRP/FNR family transcriptional regulator, cyclic AMP receptor protein